uniref:Glyoxalase domain-containing protein 4 n=1 Tax=Oncorhynchus tshawytscha TaxID=74940 RepID=A0A8C8FTL1_ONCTS
MALRQALHLVFKVGNGIKAATFYRDVLGMKILHHKERREIERRRRAVHSLCLSFCPHCSALNFRTCICAVVLFVANFQT